jgi:hypothetical protein
MVLLMLRTQLVPGRRLKRHDSCHASRPLQVKIALKCCFFGSRVRDFPFPVSSHASRAFSYKRLHRIATCTGIAGALVSPPPFLPVPSSL